MIMNCCITDDAGEAIGSEASQVDCTGDELGETNRCRSCKGKGRPVSKKTVLLMLKPELLERAMHGSYSFCSARDCSIVYLEDKGGHQFTVDDLRVRVGLKVIEDPVPLCYCFGFDESHIRDEIERTGNTKIPGKISRLIREGLCSCEARNPVGVCCLGEVNKTTTRLMASRANQLEARCAHRV
jgi:hypothetical protein